MFDALYFLKVTRFTVLILDDFFCAAGHIIIGGRQVAELASPGLLGQAYVRTFDVPYPFS